MEEETMGVSKLLVLCYQDLLYLGFHVGHQVFIGQVRLVNFAGLVPTLKVLLGVIMEHFKFEPVLPTSLVLLLVFTLHL